MRSAASGSGIVPALIALAGLALPAPAAADGWLVAAGAGLVVPDSSLGPAPRLAVEAAWLPAALGGSLALAGGLAWARPATSAATNLLGLPSSGWSASASDLALEAALAWRGQGAFGRLTPYASAGLALHLVRLRLVDWRGAASTFQEARPGLSTRLGAEWRLGAGGPFLEVGWSLASASAGPAGALELGGLFAALGWRLPL